MAFPTSPNNKEKYKDYLYDDSLSAWVESRPISATGGEIEDIDVNGSVYRVHTFKSSDVFDVLNVTGNDEVEDLIVGGGGGGGQNAGAGGGAGGYRSSVQGEMS